MMSGLLHLLDFDLQVSHERLQERQFEGHSFERLEAELDVLEPLLDCGQAGLELTGSHVSLLGWRSPPVATYGRRDEVPLKPPTFIPDFSVVSRSCVGIEAASSISIR